MCVFIFRHSGPGSIGAGGDQSWDLSLGMRLLYYHKTTKSLRGSPNDTHFRVLICSSASEQMKGEKNLNHRHSNQGRKALGRTLDTRNCRSSKTGNSVAHALSFHQNMGLTDEALRISVRPPWKRDSASRSQNTIGWGPGNQPYLAFSAKTIKCKAHKSWGNL